MKEKAFISIACLMGIAAVFYGMINKDNIVFIVGIIFIIGGYLRIRKKMKESISKKE
jgi:xanthine/uracil/vitamin C permease (AzgA family)